MYSLGSATIVFIAFFIILLLDISPDTPEKNAVDRDVIIPVSIVCCNVGN